ncbi:MAG: hypothetical protein IKT07_01055 [Oscillospiraceae bacterium]|nr:hypothetical protein [Oscillospiraceae bacterium]
MLNREDLFEATGGINDEFVASAADLLGYSKEDTILHSENKTNGGRTGRRLGRILLIAAVLTCLLAATAYAAGVFSFSTRVPDAEETFRIHWQDSKEGYLEWKDAKLVLTFPETAESREIEFRPGWLPFELPDTLAGSHPWGDLSSETWFERFSAESLCWAENLDDSPAEYAEISQPLQIETYSMSQFRDGGAMLLLYQTPGEITEEHWDDLNADVLIFHTTQHLDAVPEYDMPERTLEYNYVLLSNTEKGWIVTVCGQLGMDDVRKVAENLEIRETGNVRTQADFQNKFLFIDGGVG